MVDELSNQRSIWEKLSFNPKLSIITLNVSGRNTLVKSEIDRLDTKKNQNSTLWCLQETYFKYKDVDRLMKKNGKRHTM